MLNFLFVLSLLFFVFSLISFATSLSGEIHSWKGHLLCTVFAILCLIAGIWTINYVDDRHDDNYQDKVDECLERGGIPDRDGDDVYCYSADE